ncbi:hypothetical protein D3C71_1134010 [compost metagenome]
MQKNTTSYRSGYDSAITLLRGKISLLTTEIVNESVESNKNLDSIKVDLEKLQSVLDALIVLRELEYKFKETLFTPKLYDTKLKEFIDSGLAEKSVTDLRFTTVFKDSSILSFVIPKARFRAANREDAIEVYSCVCGQMSCECTNLIADTSVAKAWIPVKDLDRYIFTDTSEGYMHFYIPYAGGSDNE